VDYTELDAASNRGVDEVQALLEQAVYKPVQGRFKVFMIDEVHMLTNTAFNAMLKTLEEPPEYLKFVLATTDPQKVPVTVLSRCLQFNLRPMAPETIREHLVKVLHAEAVAADVQSLRLLARAARGSMRDALSLTDQAIAFGSGQISEPTVRQMLGSVDRSYVFRLIEALALGDGKTIVETSEVLRLNGLSAASTLEEMSSVLQHMAVRQAVPANGLPDDESDPEAGEVVRLAALMPADETQLLYSICLHGRAELGLAPDDYAALTMVLLRLLAFKPQNPQAGQAPVAEKKTLLKAPAPSPQPEPSPVAEPAVAATKAVPVAKAPAPIVPPARLQAWDDEPEEPSQKNTPNEPQEPAGQARAALNTVAAAPSLTMPPPGQQLQVLAMPAAGESPSVESHPSRAPLDHASDAASVMAIPVRIQADSRTEATASQAPSQVLQPSEDGEFWHATVQQLMAADSITALVRELALQSQLVARDVDQWVLRVERESLNQSGTRDRLTSALQANGHSVSLSVEVGRVTDSPARRNAALAAERQLAAEKIIFDDPFVQTMMRDYGAKIVPGSIKPG
jgi:DNA polymerase-3 subunit gamma/tau